MMSSTTLERSATLERIVKLLLGAALLVEVGGYWISARTLVDHDALVMGEVARRVVEGEQLYSEAWDNKPPLALLFYAPAQALAPGSYLGQQMFCALWTLLQAACAFMLLRAESTLVRSTVTALVLLLPLSRTDFVWASSEDAVGLFALVLTLIGYRILRRESWLGWEPWLCGALATVAFHMRQPGILFAALPLLSMAIAPKAIGAKLLGALQMAGGALLGLGVVLAIVLPTTDWASYIDAMFVAPQRYGMMSAAQLHWAFREQLVILRTHPYILMVLLALVWAPGARDRWLVLASVAVSVVVVLAPCKPFGHYQEQLIPMLVLVTLVALRALQASAPSIAATYGAALVAFYLGNALITAELLRNDHGEQAELDTIVRALERENKLHPGTLFATGPNSAYIYFKSRVRPVHPRYHWDLFLDMPYLPEPNEQVVAAILDKPPSYLVIDRATYASYTAAPGTRRRSQLVHTLCTTHACEPRGSTEHWLLLAVR